MMMEGGQGAKRKSKAKRCRSARWMWLVRGTLLRGSFLSHFVLNKFCDGLLE